MDRLQTIEQIRNNLKNGGHSIGSWIQIPHASIAEIIGKAGYDWAAVDMEHGSISLHQLPDIFRALELGGTLPLVRLAKGSTEDCQQVLDAGAGGIIVPNIHSAQQLESIRAATQWPPSGIRGVGFSRANLFGKNFEQYTQEAQNPLLIAMIENIEAVNNLDEILKIKGLDALLIGPYDLSASLGMTASFDNSEFISVIESIKVKADKALVPCGFHVVSPSINELKEKLSDGYRFLAYSTDSVILNTYIERPIL